MQRVFSNLTRLTVIIVFHLAFLTRAFAQNNPEELDRIPYEQLVETLSQKAV